LTANEWFSVDSGAHLRKLSGFHYHHNEGFLLDLVRGAVRRGARNIQVEIKPRGFRIADDGNVPDPSTLQSLRELARHDLEEARTESLIHRMIISPGIGWLAIFAPQPETAVIQVRRSGGWDHVSIIPGDLENPASHDSRLAGFHTIVVLENCRRTADISPLRLMDFLRAAPATIRINGEEVRPGHLLAGTIMARRLKRGPHSTGAIIALPKSGEACRLVLTDAGIPWDEITSPPRKGLVYHLQVEHSRAPALDFLAGWDEPARRLYRLAADAYPDLPEEERQRLEELFFLLHRYSGSYETFRQVAMFATIRPSRLTSLESIKVRASRGPLYFRLQHDGPGDRGSGPGPVLNLTSSQLEFLSRCDLHLRRVSEPVVLRGTTFQRLRQAFRTFISRLAGMIYRSAPPIPGEFLSREEKALVDLLAFHLSRRGSVVYPGHTKAFNPVVIDRRGWLPVWVGPRLGDFPIRDLIFPRRHPLFQAAAPRLGRSPGDKDLIVALFLAAIMETRDR